MLSWKEQYSHHHREDAASCEIYLDTYLLSNKSPERRRAIHECVIKSESFLKQNVTDSAPTNHEDHKDHPPEHQTTKTWAGRRSLSCIGLY